MKAIAYKAYPLLLALLYGTAAFASEDHRHEQAPASSGMDVSEAHDTDSAKHDEDHHAHKEQENSVHLNDEQRHSAGIIVEALKPKPVAEEIEAPGEVVLNAYASSRITPRIEAQVVKRHAHLGERVQKGQPLVLLSSTSMAEAQGDFLIASREWQRVKKLGKKVVSERRYLESRVTYQQAYSRLLAYGLTAEQASQLRNNATIGEADGSFTLLSPQDGTVIRDNFIVGQMVQPGDVLFEITDESSIWVEARVNPAVMQQVRVGAAVRIRSAGKWMSGKVVQIHHALDEHTRTMAVRLEIPNPGDHLHPGQFVSARIQVGHTEQAALSLPTSAVMRSPDGDWQVYVETSPGEYEPREVDIVRQIPGRVIIDGLQAGTRVVTKGAFFVQSELAKSGFSVHNH